MGNSDASLALLPRDPYRLVPPIPASAYQQPDTEQDQQHRPEYVAWNPLQQTQVLEQVIAADDH